MKIKFLLIYLFMIILSLVGCLGKPVSLGIFVVLLETQIMIAKVKHYNNPSKSIISIFFRTMISVAVLILVLFLVVTFRLEAIKKILLFQL